MGGKVTNIFNWTRSNIAFTPTFGSIQGSEGCRLSRECNAHDTASLLIALLRAAHIPARYVLGEVSLDPSFFRSAVGDFDDLQAAGRFTASSGTPTTFVVDPDQQVVAVQLAHVWVEAFVSDEKSKHAQWVTLDAALKKTDLQAPVDAEEALGFSAAPFEDILAAATFDANGDSVTNIDAAAIDQQVRGMQDQLQSFLDCCTTVGEITGFLQPKVREVRKIQQLRKAFPGTIVQAEAAIAELPAAVRHLLTLQVAELSGVQVITISRTLPELVNRRLTVAYFPATREDAEFVVTNGGLYAAPPTGFQVKPVVMLDSEIIAAGTSVPMGVLQQLRLTFREVGDVSDFVDHFIRAGTYAIVGLNFQRAGSESLLERRARLAATLEELRSESGVHLDDILGETLHDQAQIYYALLDTHTRLSAQKLNVVFGRRPAEMLMSFAPVFVFDENGIPIATQSGSMGMDFRRNILSVASRTGRTEDEGSWFFGVGAYSSALEHSIFEITQDTASVSTLRLIRTASDQGIPIFAIDARNLARVLPQLNLPNFVIDMIVEAVAAGNFVVTPRTEVQFLQWRGVGFIIIDPVTGAGAYLIAGNLVPAPTTVGGATAEISAAIFDIQTVLRSVFLIEFPQPSPSEEFLFVPFTGPPRGVPPPAEGEIPDILAPVGVTVGGTNSVASEGLTLIAREVDVTATDAAVFEAPARTIQSLSPCARATLANEESGAIDNNLLWEGLFGSPAGIPTARTQVPSLSAFVFDSLQEKLKEQHAAAPNCQ